MINLELFPCSGGFAEGFRRAGVTFDLSVEIERDHCDSYEHNLGHRPVQMDVRDLLRMVKLGVRIEVDLLVADPPCTPWSRAGKRLGTEDERDMLVETCELIAALRPRRYLIGNVPGLDDAVNWHIVQKHVGGLTAHGYCVRDFAALDAADYGVPQRRVRPFWFGHLAGDCIRWPRPTHADPAKIATPALPGIDDGIAALKPWVTCRDALGHLTGPDLGRPVHLRWKAGTDGPDHKPSRPSKPAKTLTRNTHSDGCLLLVNEKHPPSDPAAPAATIGAKRRMQAGEVLLVDPPQSKRVGDVDAPAKTITAKHGRVGVGADKLLSWPWDRPATTIHADPRIAPPGHHDSVSFAAVSEPNAVVLSARAAAILQGFPDEPRWLFSGETQERRWSQLGQAMPPPLAHAVATSVVEQDEATRGKP